MAIAENLRATHAVDERVKGVSEQVLVVDDRVAHVDDRLAGVDDTVANVNDKVTEVIHVTSSKTGRFSAIAGDFITKFYKKIKFQNTAIPNAAKQLSPPGTAWFESIFGG